MIPHRLKQRRKELKLSQDDVAQRLGITRQGYGHYETGRNEPDNETLIKLSEILNCSVDFLLGLTDDPTPPNSNNTVRVAGQEIELTPEELRIFEEIKKHPILFHDLATDTEKKVRQLIKMWKFIKEDLEKDDVEMGEGFGEIED
ncbi:hypothetical protein BSNK01_12580 [Bacillaceae bacterium]